jgi:N-acetylmuramic acid 6-phosphate (MurNAc-6-P) etherase
MKPTNHKLLERAKFIVRQVCGVTVEQATRQLELDSWQIRTAIQHLRAQAKG